ncbi:MAG: GspH/FimT family pseudopilin [Desulfobacteraceae bacterium]|jgi:prepilin-type N-terminal cleavage/methylation domain-containing protein
MRSLNQKLKTAKKSHRLWRPGNCCGFTLIELMIVIALGTTLMAIAVLSFRGVVRHHAAEELISELRLAGLMAIRQHRNITVTFNPGTAQYAMAWSDAGGAVTTRMGNTGGHGETFVFDPAPPGNPPAPDAAFIFSPLGFISTLNGNVAGNIYLTNTDNSRQFQIQTTIAGGIDLNRFDPTVGWVQAY